MGRDGRKIVEGTEGRGKRETRWEERKERMKRSQWVKQCSPHPQMQFAQNLSVCLALFRKGIHRGT